MDSPLAPEIRLATSAIRSAAQLSQLILSQSSSSSSSVPSSSNIVAKPDLSPVTVADLAIQALLAATFHAAYPADVLVGEESSAQLRASPDLASRVWELLQTLLPPPPQVRIPASRDEVNVLLDRCAAGAPASGGRSWIFDPIDGTQNFVRGRLYAVNVALLRDGEQVLGVVGCPNLSADVRGPVADGDLDGAGEGCIVFAAKGYGTYVTRLFVDGLGGEPDVRRIEREQSAAGELRNVTCAGQLASGLEDVHAVAAGRLDIAYPGSNLLPWVLRWVALAIGLGNTCFWAYRSRTRRGKVWDHAGAMLLFEEVGGRITDVEGKDINVGVGREMSQNWGFVAALEGDHARVLRVVREVLGEMGGPG